MGECAKTADSKSSQAKKQRAFHRNTNFELKFCPEISYTESSEIYLSSCKKQKIKMIQKENKLT